MVNPTLTCEHKNAKACADELDALATELLKRVEKIRKVTLPNGKLSPQAVAMAATFARDKLEQAAWEMQLQIRRDITDAERWF